MEIHFEHNRDTQIVTPQLVILLRYLSDEHPLL